MSLNKITISLKTTPSHGAVLSLLHVMLLSWWFYIELLAMACLELVAVCTTVTSNILYVPCEMATVLSRPCCLPWASDHMVPDDLSLD